MRIKVNPKVRNQVECNKASGISLVFTNLLLILFVTLVSPSLMASVCSYSLSQWGLRAIQTHNHLLGPLVDLKMYLYIYQNGAMVAEW